MNLQSKDSPFHSHCWGRSQSKCFLMYVKWLC